MLTTPARSTTGDLHLGLQRGSVERVLLEEPPTADELVGGTALPTVTWTSVWGRELTATLPTPEAAADVRAAVEQSPGDVHLMTVEAGSVRTTTPVPLIVTGLVGALGAFLYLVGGPAPRLATRWAWFWLASAFPLLWLVLVLAEPVPLWPGVQQATARQRRVTGGVAFVISLVLGSVLAGLLPEGRGLLVRA